MTTPASPLSRGTATLAVPLSVHSLGQRYGSKWVLKDCSFDLRPHAVTALIGPNGAGKSTLMSAIAGLHQPTEGRIEIEGTPITASPSHPHLGYLAQDKPLYRQYKIADMVAIARNLNARWDQAHCDELIDAAKLDRKQKIATLSGGQRTRLALALVLARRPSVLLLDEPLADLDPLARLEVQRTLMTEVVDTGMTVLMSSHILGEVADLCEDILVMGTAPGGGGNIALAGSIDEILATHRILVGPGTEPDELGFIPAGSIVEAHHARRQTTLIVDRPVGPLPEGWTSGDPTMDDVVLAYLRADGLLREGALAGSSSSAASTTAAQS